MIPISSIGFLIGAAVSYFSFWHLKKNRQKKELKDKEINYFLGHFIFYGTFLFGLGIIPLLAPQNTLALQLTFPISVIFWFIGYAFMIYAASSYRFILLQKPLTILTLIAGAALTTASFIKLNNPIIEKGIILWNFQPPVTFLVPLFLTIFMVLPMLVFFYEAIKNTDQNTRRRSLFWALAFLIGIIAGPTHALVQTPLQNFLIDIGLIVGYFLKLAGAIYKRSNINGQIK